MRHRTIGELKHHQMMRLRDIGLIIQGTIIVNDPICC
jgi:hypothetical protein